MWRPPTRKFSHRWGVDAKDNGSPLTYDAIHHDRIGF